ncbi:MAG: hypothetical protein ACD_22C00067G0001 [uncultured bacterium]|nr:MAG: hypothetical protein ACD_22C00067G0001 [uncultured bacterium]
MEKVEKVPVWDDEVLKFLDEATKDKNSREKKSAFEKKLKVKGFVFKEKNPEEDEKLYAAIDACLLNKGNEKHKNPTVALAYLKEYFGVVEGERDENKENLEKKIKDLVDKKDRFGLSEMMAGGTDEKLFNWAVGIMTGGKLNEEFPTSEKAWEYFKAHIKMGGLSGETEKTKDSGQVEAEQPVWYPEVLDDLDIGTLDEDGVDSVKKQKAVKRLLGHGIDLSKHKSWKRLKEAFDSRVKYGDRFYGKFKSKKEAGDYILKSFGVVKPTVAGDVKVEFSEDTLRAEGDFVEAAVEPVVVPEVRPVVVERNPIRRLELMCDPTKWQQVMNIVENSRTEEEKKKHKLALRALIFQLEHPEERVNTRGRWETLYIPYLRQLGVEESKLV